MSRIDMNIPNTMMRNAINRRGAMRSEGAAAAFIITGGAAASAMICSGQNLLLDPARRRLRKLLRLSHGRRVEVGFAVGIRGAGLAVDRRIDRPARAHKGLLPV